MSSRKTAASQSSKQSKAEKDVSTKDERMARARSVAIQQALSIEEKKNLQNKVLDMILIAYDLPSVDPADPAYPDPIDVQTFRQCLALFRPADLDELVSERNIDDRCGYALCRRPNLKKPPKKTWDAKGRLVEKKTDGQWCSKDCQERNAFVRKQLSEEPVWLRSDESSRILLLMDTPYLQPDIPIVQVSPPTVQNTQQKELAQERGDRGGTDDITIIEKENTQAPMPPSLTGNDVMEGLPMHNIAQSRKQRP